MALLEDIMTGRFAATFRIPRALVMAAAACTGIPSPADASPALVNALNAVRANGCGGRSGAAPRLQENAQLTQAAKHAGRLPLQDALAKTGYRASRSALIRVQSDPGAMSVADVVAGSSCAYLAEPGFREIGVHQQLRETWIILAAPFSPPAAEASNTVAKRVLELVNEARTQARACGDKRFAAAGRLKLNATLSKTSLAHAADMAQHGNMAHTGSDGSTPADRATRAGYRWRSVGENVAAGQTTPEAAVESWIKSPPHCANLMAPHFTEMGVAYSVDRASKAGIYWAQLFGTPR
jgi:uncharacterized protein YkwD